MNYLIHPAEGYLQAVKALKVALAAPMDKKRSREAQERERATLEVALEALRYAALCAENPPLTRAHLKDMHGRAVYLEHPPQAGTLAGIVDCRNETILSLSPFGGADTHEWFCGNTGRYYRFPLGGAGLMK
ncbi:hypothetical protein CE91St41_01350 [Oscillospiraceae bacterium]|nr:hypothetical protein CE91St40_01350 [Oscillospiraceae bacterium]BDF73246.1 hypothetical protein CE91St41_01350 [Oscillospiraceae bacterium]